jgi:hypothetical protein
MNSGLDTFSNHRSAEPVAWIHDTVAEGGFPHSEILGSKLVRSSPRLIAAYHVLHRLSAPRHPPDALKALDRSHDRCPAVSESLLGFVTTIHGHDKDRQPALSNPLPYACRTHPGRPLSQRPGHIPSSRCQISAATRDCVDGAKLFDPDDPATSAAFGRGGWWSWTGSNRRPHACKARALPTELQPRGAPLVRSRRSLARPKGRRAAWRGKPEATDVAAGV